MTKRKYKLIKIHSSNDDTVHYKTERGEFDPAETWCGDVDIIGVIYTETADPITCRICSNTAEILKAGFIAT